RTSQLTSVTSLSSSSNCLVSPLPVGEKSVIMTALAPRNCGMACAMTLSDCAVELLVDPRHVAARVSAAVHVLLEAVVHLRLAVHAGEYDREIAATDQGQHDLPHCGVVENEDNVGLERCNLLQRSLTLALHRLRRSVGAIRIHVIRLRGQVPPRVPS